NGDGRLDLMVANLNSDTVSVLLGNGDGSFQDSFSVNAGGYPGYVAVGDFNGDSFPDLVVLDVTFGNLTVLLNAADWDTRSLAALEPGQRLFTGWEGYLVAENPVHILTDSGKHEGLPVSPRTARDHLFAALSFSKELRMVQNLKPRLSHRVWP